MEADNRIRYALNPDNVDKKSSTYFNANSYKILISIVLILFAFLIFDIIDWEFYVIKVIDDKNHEYFA
jgi:hypothetical protein